MEDFKLPLDIEAVRADFPVLHQDVRPGVPLVYFDNAATSQKPQAVIDVLDDYYARYNSNVHRGIHKLSEEATEAYEHARQRATEFINGKSARQAIFTRNTTEGINLIAHAWGRENLHEGDVVLTTEMEHHSNIVPWQMLAERYGYELKFVPITDEGEIDIEAYHNLLDERVKLVTFMHVSNVLGTVQPVREMVDAAHAVGATVHVDGAQSVPHIPVDVQALDCDFYTFSGHKMVGPTGIGVLYGKRDVLEAMPPWMGGGDMIRRVTLEGTEYNDIPYRFEAGTPNIAGAIGLGAAVDYLTGIGMDVIHEHERVLTAYALERLAEVPGVSVLGPNDANRKCGVAAMVLEDAHPHDVAQILDHEGIAVRAGHHCAMPLHQRFGVVASTRASFYLYNTLGEIDRLIEGLYEVKKLFAF